MARRTARTGSTAAGPAAALAGALDALDRAFAIARADIGRVDGCPHCFTEPDLAALGGPADRIAEDLLRRALARWGGTLDARPRSWRHWTPRVLRLLTTGRLALDAEMPARKFQEAGWEDWPPGEAAALRTVLTAWRRYAAEPAGPAAGAEEFLGPLLGAPG